MAARLSELQHQLLECPICLGRLRPPIETCINGHGICRECKQNLQVCGVCRQDFSRERNVLLNQLIESLPAECKYSTEGCKHNGIIKDIANHENVCAYKPDYCFLCDQEFSFMNFKNHLYKHEGVTTTHVGWSDSFQLQTTPGTRWLNHVVSVRSETDSNIRVTFVVRCFCDWQREAFLFCIQYIGKKEDAKRYMYHISINQGSTSTKYYFGCNGICVPYFYSEDEIFSTSKTIELSLKSIFFDSKYFRSGFMMEVILNRFKEDLSLSELENERRLELRELELRLQEKKKIEREPLDLCKLKYGRELKIGTN